MAADLVPHYLGLALPVAFTAATFMATARMCDDSELDIMLSTGRSIARIAAPYFVLALLLSVSNLYLFGALQPLARYDYHVKMDQGAADQLGCADRGKPVHRHRPWFQFQRRRGG